MRSGRAMAVEVPIKVGDSAKSRDVLRLHKTIRKANSLAALRMTGLIGVVLSLVMSSATASGITYYVSSSSGNDSNSGTSASSSWQTIAHVNGQTFQPGDSILFKRGDAWNESLAPPSSGSSGNPITFDAYGTGAAPNVTGYYAVPTTACYVSAVPQYEYLGWGEQGPVYRYNIAVRSDESLLNQKVLPIRSPF